MSKNLRLLIFVLVSLTIASVAYAGRYSTDFPQYLADHNSDGMVTGIVTMTDRVDLRALQDQLYAQHADRRLWHETVVRALQEKATTTQANLLADLAVLAQSGQVQKYTPLWVGNVVIVTAQPAVFEQLVTRDDILQIDPDYNIVEIQPVSRGGDEPTIAGHEIGADRLHVPEVWAMGITGEGRLVSHLDTGVDGTHPALAARWRGVADSRYEGHPDWAWFDPLTNTQFPQDWGQHGTHTMGTICGRSTTTADTVGMAIDAQWISCGVIDRQSIPQTVADALLSFQWIVDPDQDPATVWDVPDVNSNSWGVTTGHGYPDCDPTFWEVLDGAEAAGIVVVFAAGNEGPGANTLRRPADRATTDLTSFSVGAVDGNSQSLPIADFSSRGPSYCTPDGNPTFKPEVVAPGVNVRSSVPGGGYQGGWSGTSMATPHIAGIVALMRQANPNLTSEQVRQILLDTADDLGTEGEDNTYGKGVANALAAVNMSLAFLQGWGTLGGIITDQASGQPIQGARVSVVGRPWGANSRANGQYYLFMPADTAWNIRVEFPPTHLPLTDIVTVTENDTLIRNYALEGKVPTILTASFGNPSDASYRSFYIKGSWNSDGFYDANWSAPLIEVKDDGQAPDQTANDGIFTARVLLGRDMTHTYSWALYTENYGADLARLQHGASFQITTLVPPSVPTLSVNPSGSDHNWGFSIAGDHSLAVNLSRNDLTHPTRWNGVESLFVGTTYTFRTRVMHSDSSVYGNGGVGGTQMVYTPTISGAYEFRFDDRDDITIVQLAGTEGPPTYLSARSGLDHHVPVSWLPPGTVESQEMSYDDGTLANAYYYYDDANLMAEMFVPQSYPVLIDSVMIHVLTDGDQYWPWPDGTHDPINVFVFLDDGTGMPSIDPAFVTEATGEPGQWIVVDVPDIEVPNGQNFWIAMGNIAGGGEEGIGLDAMTDYPANKWNLFSGSWIQQDLYSGDHMIRAKVFGNARDGWMGYDSSPAGPINAQVKHGGDASQMAATGQLQPNGGSSSLMAYHPRLSPTNPPTILDIQVDGYNLYRSTSAGPYNNGNPANRVNTSRILTTNYDDWGGAVGHIVNGTTYHYQASALYLISSDPPVYVEVGPSNEAVATPVNGPPPVPTNLVGTVNDRTIHVTWSFVNRDSDFAHFNVFKRQLPSGNTVLVGTTTNPVFDVVIPGGEDGIYRITVTAVDDGTPALESEPSRGLEEPIGHLPPGALTARSGYEFEVPLRWMRPGAFRALGDDTPGTPGAVTPDLPQPLDLSHKGEVGPQNPPVVTGRGGPDAFGYTWVDSDEPDGPAFEWIDITGIGTQIPMLNDDQNLGPFDVGFDVNFYGNTFNQFYVCSNGWVSFTDVNAYYFNQGLPNTSGTPFNLIAPFWDDLYPPNGGEYWYYSDGAQLVISFINVMHIGTGGPYTFQAVIRPSGTVIYNYDVLGSPTNQCTVGIQNGDGTIGLQMTFDSDYLHDAMSIRLSTGLDGFTPAHYKLYRSLTPSFPMDAAHLLNGSVAGDLTVYSDRYQIVNGTTYYYKISAVWPDSVESPGSNEASATPANHAPEAPYNLHGTVDNRNITVFWSFTNLMGDLDHYKVYKKQVPGGTWVEAGTTAETTFVVNIPVGQDGVYQIAAAAVDNGSPQMEGARSNAPAFSVGNLPPNALVAEDGLEAHVPLHWSEPGLLPTTTLQYDDGVLANAYYYYDFANLMAEQFVATAPVTLDTIWVHVLTDGDQYWPWPDGTHDPVSISVFEDDGSGMPALDPIFTTEATCEPGQWIMVPIEGGLTINSSNFWIAMGNLDGGGDEGIGLDAISDYPQYKWNLFSGSWIQQDLYTGDHMIRATIVDNGRSLLLSEKAPTQDLARKLASEGSYSGVAATAGVQRPSDMPVSMAMNAANSLNPTMALNSGNGGNISRPLDTEVLVGYQIYKGTAPNVPIDDAHRLRTWGQQGVSRVYDDSAVTNGTTYYYKVTAMYLNNSIYEESPASNEETGLPTNHPPQAPFGLNGTVDGRNVTLHWSFFNLNHDLDHFNIYKKLVPGGSFVLAGSSTDSTAVINIPVGEDGVYAFEVAAVDNGTPQLESGMSNLVYISVGLLPPVNLRATTNQDACVPLAWNEPGLRPTTTLQYDDGVLANAYYYYDFANLMAEQFVATAPVQLDTIWVHVLTDGDQYWPWPDGTHDPVGISVYADDGNGMPGDQVFYQEATGEPGEWIMIPIDGGVEIPTSNFWIAMGNLEGGGDEGIGLDAVSDYPQYKWNLFSGQWMQQDLYTGDHMIRATIVDNGRSLLLSEKAPTEELARKAGPVSFQNDGATAPSLSTHGSLAVNNAGDGDLPRLLDTQVLVGYSIYRSTTANVPIDDAHRIRGYQTQGLTRTYVDSAVVNGTTYYYKVTAVYLNNSIHEESPGSNEVSGTPRLGGRMVLNPLSFNVTGMPGQVGTQPLNISNPGGMEMNYNIVAQSNRLLLSHNRSNRAADAASNQHITVDKSNYQPPTHPDNPPVLLGRGGPDEFGYQWIDSDEPGGPSYSWIDITDRGQQIPITNDDQNSGPLDIGFDVNFYGSAFNQFSVCSNGWISFTDANAYYFNQPLPNTSGTPYNLIAPFWDDLYPPYGGEYWYYSDGSQLVVSFINVMHIGTGGPYTFQVILQSSGAITFNYGEMTDPLNTTTIGIQNGDGSIGLQVAYDQDYVHSDMAIRITAGWLSADPSNGTVPMGENRNVNIVFDATDLQIGVYTGSLTVTGSDVNHQIGQVQIPVTFHVVQDVVDEPVDLPKEFGLSQNYPNPFNPTTEIEFTLPTKAFVSLDVFNVLGQRVKSLVNSDMEAGYKSVIWDGTDISGSSVASGTYFYVLKAGDKVFTKKMTMLK